MSSNNYFCLDKISVSPCRGYREKVAGHQHINKEFRIETDSEENNSKICQ